MDTTPTVAVRLLLSALARTLGAVRKTGGGQGQALNDSEQGALSVIGVGSLIVFGRVFSTVARTIPSTPQ